MSILRLPAETLSQIFEHLGPSFFHENPARLTICKQWYGYALPTCLSYITLSRETLRRFTTCQAVAQPSPLEYHLEALDVELRAYVATDEDATHDIDLSKSSGRFSPRSRIDTLEHDLARLASIMQRCRRLRTLRLTAWRSIYNLESLHDYLSLPTMCSLLSLKNLSVLVLDLSVGFQESSGEPSNGHHVCPAIGTLLDTLQTLHIRMRSICPDALKTQHTVDKLALSTVIVNLSLKTNLPGITSATHSRRCGAPSGGPSGGLLRLFDDMRQQAQTLASAMTSPRTVRILTHSLPSFETHSLDVVTDETRMLEDGSAWDDDGQTIWEPPEPESELSDDELLAWLDD